MGASVTHLDYCDDEGEGRKPRRRLAPVHDIPLDLWGPELVMARLVEAARVILFTAGPVGPRGFGSGFPRELADAIGFDEEAEPDPRTLRRKNVSARRMTLVEQASDWPIIYLRDHDGARRVLALFLACKAYRRSFGEAVKKRKWSRATAYRRRDEALRRIAEGLNSNRVPVRL